MRHFRNFLSPNILLPIAGFAGTIALWWLIALFRHAMMPTPPEALLKVKLTAAADKYPDELSGGMKQRFGVRAP